MRGARGAPGPKPKPKQRAGAKVEINISPWQSQPTGNGHGLILKIMVRFLIQALIHLTKFKQILIGR